MRKHAMRYASALVVTLAGAGVARAQGSQEAPILQDLLRRYQGCILERYETRQTERLTPRDKVKCVAGNTCSLADRQAAWAALAAQAQRGDATGFDQKLHAAIPADCFQCQKHAKWHTKHVHCTMDCGGNNGIPQGPCFEGCKAGVDLSALAAAVARDIQVALAGIGSALGGSGRPPETQEIGGLSVAKNRSIVNPTDPESCDPSWRGYFIAPSTLLDWTPTQAPPFKHVLTGYEPPAPPSSAQYMSPPLHNIGANEGRLRADLRAAAARANPFESLCKAAAALALGNAADGYAFADLAVTGRRAFAAFRAGPPQDAQVLACLQRDPRVASAPAATQQRAAKDALDRAYRVAGLLRTGGWPVACPERAALGYAAVSSEDDQPHRPVNVPSAEFPQYELDVSVPRPNGPPLTVHTRYMIAHTRAPAGAEPLSCALPGRALPRDRAPVLAPDAEVFAYVPGMDSRLEEAMDLTRALHALGRQRGKNYTVISVDLPGAGYADKINPDLIGRPEVRGRATGVEGLGFAPNRYAVPFVDFTENFIVAFLNTLDRSIPVTRHLRAIVGGSEGGNMSMRLGRPRPDAPWVTNVVPWSPASAWPSFADSEAQHAALAVPWHFAGGDPAFAVETPGARRSFFYGGFDWKSEAFGFVKLGGGRPQADYWYRDGWACKELHERLARIERYETYDPDFRRDHWLLGLDQLLFSQQIKQAGSGQPLYHANTKRILLMCGMDDTGGSLCQHTREMAQRMEYTPGYALFLNTTGHSIHNERPNFLARHIADFIEPQVPWMTMEYDTERAGTVMAEIALAAPDPALCRDACLRDSRCAAFTYVRPGGRRHLGPMSGPPVPTAQCWLKSNAGAMAINVDDVSGVRKTVSAQ